MNKNQKVTFFTTLIGDYDYLNNFNWTKEYNFEFICITDQKTINPFWKKIPLPKNLINRNFSFTVKYIKTHFHKIYPCDGILIWIDANITIKEKILDIIAEFYKKKYDFFFIKHPYRNNIKQEISYLRDNKFKNNPEKMSKIQRNYDEINRNFQLKDDLLIEANFFIIRDRKCYEKLSSCVWNLLKNYPFRDQIFFPISIKLSNLNYKLIDIGYRKKNIYYNINGHKEKNFGDIYGYFFSKRHFFFYNLLLIIWTPFHIFYNKFFRKKL